VGEWYPAAGSSRRGSSIPGQPIAVHQPYLPSFLKKKDGLGRNGDHAEAGDKPRAAWASALGWRTAVTESTTSRRADTLSRPGSVGMIRRNLFFPPNAPQLIHRPTCGLLRQSGHITLTLRYGDNCWVVAAAILEARASAVTSVYFHTYETRFHFDPPSVFLSSNYPRSLESVALYEPGGITLLSFFASPYRI